MSIRDSHYLYDENSDDYSQMRDTYEGQRTVKDATVTYLYPTSSQILDGAYNPTTDLVNTNSTGYSNYLAYQRRALFPELVREAAHTLCGLIFKDPAEYYVPDVLQPLLTSCTKQGGTLESLHRHVVLNQLLYGRVGLAVDFNAAYPLPYFVPYSAEQIINWDTFDFPLLDTNNLNYLVTVETSRTRNNYGNATSPDYAWTVQDKYRAMYLNDETGVYETYSSSYGDDDGFVDALPMTPTYLGRALDFVPFTIIGSQDLSSEPNPIPLLGISNAALSIYHQEADYREALHLSGQDTLVLSGIAENSETNEASEDLKVGANALITLPENGKAEYVGIRGVGLDAQRVALREAYDRAAAEGARLMENQTGGNAESAEALRVRVSAKTTTLTGISITAASGLEAALRQVAMIVGADPGEVRVEPNLDFTQDVLSPQDLTYLIQAKNDGAPISMYTIHEHLRQRDLTNLTFDEEMGKVATETTDGTLETIDEGRLKGENGADENSPGNVPDEEDENPTEE